MNKIEYFPSGGIMDLSYFPYYGKQAQVSNSDVISNSQDESRHTDLRFVSMSS